MPFLTLSATPTAGNDEVLATLLYLSAGPEAFSNGVSKREITLNLQRNGHYGLHADRLTTLEAEVATVLANLITATYVQTTAKARGHGEESVLGYQLTRAGVLPARRAQPYALWS